MALQKVRQPRFHFCEVLCLLQNRVRLRRKSTKLDVALGIARDSYDGKWGLNLFTFRDEIPPKDAIVFSLQIPQGGKRLDQYAPGTAVRGALQDAVEEVPRPELTRIQSSAESGATTRDIQAPVTRTKHNNRMHNKNNKKKKNKNRRSEKPRPVGSPSAALQPQHVVYGNPQQQQLAAESQQQQPPLAHSSPLAHQQQQPNSNNGYASPMSTSSYDPYSPNSKIGGNQLIPSGQREWHCVSNRDKNRDECYVSLPSDIINIDDILSRRYLYPRLPFYLWWLRKIRGICEKSKVIVEKRQKDKW
ncbi:Ecdysone receptor [Apis cerana cerana]|uniref:Ecdysone receptor n=1 Tax=Apis cerana cerana TaxID=94128 RepID=A0A2A3E5L6_APICC|nr:Ecdysone receptor [Apis cerana cerana]